MSSCVDRSGVHVVTDPFRTAAAVLASASDVTLLAHVNPDADSLGSALALGITLRRRGIPSRVAFASPDAMPETLRPLDVEGLVVPPWAVPEEPDVVVACDAAEPARLGALQPRLDRARVSVMIDHHASNPGFGDVRVLDPDAQATVVLARGVLAALDAPLDVDVARCLYAGLATDTGGFRRARADAHRLAAELVDAGVEPEAVLRPIMDTHPFPWLAALGDVLAGAQLDRGAAGGAGLVHAVVPASTVARFRSEEVDSVVDVVASTAEAEVALVLKQVGPGRFTASLRSKGAVDVAAVAVALGGGGHRMAAGFTADGGAPELVAGVRAALEPQARRAAS